MVDFQWNSLKRTGRFKQNFMLKFTIVYYIQIFITLCFPVDKFYIFECSAIYKRPYKNEFRVVYQFFTMKLLVNIVSVKYSITHSGTKQHCPTYASVRPIVPKKTDLFTMQHFHNKQRTEAEHTFDYFI